MLGNCSLLICHSLSSISSPPLVYHVVAEIYNNTTNNSYSSWEVEIFQCVSALSCREKCLHFRSMQPAHKSVTRHCLTFYHYATQLSSTKICCYSHHNDMAKVLMALYTSHLDCNNALNVMLPFPFLFLT